MSDREIEDLLREQYFDLLPQMNEVAHALATRIEYALLPIRERLAAHETLIIKVRIKSCVNAIEKLRQVNPLSGPRNPGGVFDRGRPDAYRLTQLRDLVGARVLLFPSALKAEVDNVLRATFADWQADPIRAGEHTLALKYNGTLEKAGLAIPCEYQIASTLIGLFWEVEHAALYKQAPNLRGLTPLLQDQTDNVYASLREFEAEFERQLKRSEQEKISHS